MKKIPYLGIIACLGYTFAIIVGGFLLNGYSHLNQAISEIEPLLKLELSIRNEFKIIVTIFFGIYNLLVMLYGLFMLIFRKKKSIPFVIQFLGLTLVGLIGLLLYFFPMDVAGNETTIKGIMHIVLVSFLAPLSIMIPFFGFFTFKENRAMRIYSLITSIVILISGILTTVFISNGIETGFGLLERITIGSFIIWIFVSSLYLIKKSKSSTELKNE